MHTQWFMVNLPLYYYEKKWLRILDKEIRESQECSNQEDIFLLGLNVKKWKPS